MMGTLSHLFLVFSPALLSMWELYHKSLQDQFLNDSMLI